MALPPPVMDRHWPVGNVLPWQPELHDEVGHTFCVKVPLPAGAGGAVGGLVEPLPLFDDGAFVVGFVEPEPLLDGAAVGGFVEPEPEPLFDGAGGAGGAGVLPALLEHGSLVIRHWLLP
jgi:hypothetical protein